MKLVGSTQAKEYDMHCRYCFNKARLIEQEIKFGDRMIILDGHKDSVEYKSWWSKNWIHGESGYTCPDHKRG